jgi:hypothetical protein
MSDILRNVVYIAYIRWYNHRNPCYLSFNGIVTAVFNVQDGKIEQGCQKIIDELNGRSTRKTKPLTCEEIDAFIQENRTDDTFNLCNGHDVTKLTALILEYKTGNTISREDYCRILRESFQISHFIQTRLYDKLLSWQNTNGFDILNADPGAANG